MNSGPGWTRDRRSRCANRVTYWTGIWEPRYEAVSKGVAQLRQELAPGCPVVSFTPQRSRLLSADRVVLVNNRRWLSLRSAALVLERVGNVTHIFGGVGAVAHFMYVLGRRPILLTAVIPGSPHDSALYDRVERFVAESRGLAATLIGAGVSSDRIDVIYPATDIRHHALRPTLRGRRFRLLFASTPLDPAEIDHRGIGLLIELARLRPDIDIVIPWRQWGRVDEARRILESREPPANFLVEHRNVADMHAMYGDIDATICCFETGFGKSAPNFVVEGLASGRPALLTDSCGIADVVDEWQAGVVASRSAESLARGVDELRSRYCTSRLQARRLAEAEFDSQRALQRYENLYRMLAARS